MAGLGPVTGGGGASGDDVLASIRGKTEWLAKARYYLTARHRLSEMGRRRIDRLPRVMTAI